MKYRNGHDLLGQLHIGKRVLKGAGIAAAFLLIIGCVLGYLVKVCGFTLPAFEKAVVEETNQIMVQTASVSMEEALAEEASRNDGEVTRTFMNRGSADADDGREVFRIIEVIPNEVCSVFPYLVEWNTKEEYDKNVPIGYYGVWLIANSHYDGAVQMSSAEDVAAQYSKPYTYQKDAMKREFLDVYEGMIGGSWQNLYYRSTDSWPHANTDGYFEYVGGNASGGYGLYGITFGFDYDWSGQIKTKIAPKERDGKSSGKGNLYVASPAYYWPKSLSSSAKPSYGYGGTPGQMTGYNYDLKFEQQGSGTYKAEQIRYSGAQNSVGSGYDYLLKVEQSGTVAAGDWISGFTYKNQGNYQASSATANVAGRYFRVSENGVSDGCPGVGIGYFRLATPQDDVTKRYDVTFASVTAGLGTYVANPAASGESKKYSYQYAGDGLGQYAVTFAYCGKSDSSSHFHYATSVVKVTDGKGAYGLTSMTYDPNQLYTETATAGQEPDYSRVIVNMPYYNYPATSQSGCYVGGYGAADEIGTWVFHEITDPSEMKYTDVNAVRNGKFQFGDRIYVYGQERERRYYVHDNFVNNEWFKLLVYSTNPNNPEKPYSEIVNGVGYDFNDTALHNLNKTAAANIISGFDSSKRLEILQKTPEQLTVSDVRNCDLLYFSNAPGVEGMMKAWKSISDSRTAVGLRPLANIEVVDGAYAYANDISTEVLFEIYDCCLYRKEASLMMCASVGSKHQNGDGSVSSNLAKLYYLMNFFENPKIAAYYMEDYYEYIETNSKILLDGRIKVIRDYNGFYNTISPENYGSSIDNAWKNDYFLKYNWNGTWETVPKSNYDFGKVEYIDKLFRDENGDYGTWLTFQWYGVAQMMNVDHMYKVWRILQSRDQENAELVVNITNGELTTTSPPVRYIYGDEFDPNSFDVNYNFTLVGYTQNRGNIASVKISFTDDGSVIETPSGRDFDAATDYTVNVRKGFTVDGSANGDLAQTVTSRTVRIEATDTRGRTGFAEVVVMIRPAFDLN